MVGMGMIFDETYRPFFEQAHAAGDCTTRRSASATSSWPPSPAAPAARAEAYRKLRPASSVATAVPKLHRAERRSSKLLESRRRFRLRRHARRSPLRRRPRLALEAGKHVLIEKPSVLSLAELDELERLAGEHGVLAKVVYHKLLDPDHKKLRTLVADGELQHVNNGYCSLLEPKSISGGQFAEWIAGRNPGTYVAVHYIKLIDFTFGGRLKSVHCTGQRGIVGPADGPTWDSTQLRLDLRVRRRPRSGVRHSHQLGHARQFPRLRRARSAVPLRQRRVERPQPQAGRRMHGRRRARLTRSRTR